MKNIYYSYCCGKYVERNSERPDLVEQGVIPVKGHHCSRCKKPVTCYGYPKLEEDKKAWKENQKQIRKDNGIRGSKLDVRKDGVYLINKLYPKAELTDTYESLVDNWVLFDYFGHYVSAIKVEHKSGAVYIEQDALKERLKKARLYAVRMDGFKYEPYISQLRCIDDLGRTDVLRQYLLNMGWKFDKNGKLK